VTVVVAASGAANRCRPRNQFSKPDKFLACGHNGNKFLVEEKTISYVTSGREVVRIANPLTRSATTLSPSDGERAGRGALGKSLVMGNPDFDLDLGSTRDRSAAVPSRSTSNTANTTESFQRGSNFMAVAAQSLF
jgi:hypothetical protein